MNRTNISNKVNTSSKVEAGMDKREFPNTLADYRGETLVGSDGQVAGLFTETLLKEIDVHLKTLAQVDVDTRSYSIYTGCTGNALLHYHLSKVLPPSSSKSHQQSSLKIVERTLRHLKRRKASFLCGDGGPLALGAVLYDEMGNEKASQECIERLLSRQRDVLDGQDDIPDELFNGRTGYLFALLYVQKHLGIDVTAVVEKVFKEVIRSGERLSRQQGSSCPLMYEWHTKKYLGAAHGLVGIFMVLLQVCEASCQSSIEQLVKPSIDFLMTLRFPSGNFPSSVDSATGDKLVHWCHGAPGWLHMFALAYKRFGDAKYLDEAKSCGEVLWSRGLLRKGYGLCHGVSGNAYGFLALYKLTNDPKHLHRAFKFAEWCFDQGRHGCATPDNPYSLFEGLAGVVYFMADLLEPKNAKFPAFEL